MSAVVAMGRKSLTAGTEIGVMAYGALVTIAHDPILVLLGSAKRAIAVDPMVDLFARARKGQRLMDGDKAMTRVGGLGILDAVIAIVPVWASQALVANTIEILSSVSIEYQGES